MNVEPIALPASTGQLASPQDPPVSPITSVGFAAAHSHSWESKLVTPSLYSKCSHPPCVFLMGCSLLWYIGAFFISIMLFGSLLSEIRIVTPV